MFDDDPDEYLYLMVIFFGILPEPWWSTSWEFRRKYEAWPTPGKLEYVKREISPEEVKLFSDLLRRLFRFKQEERLSAKEVQGHKWFSLGT
ncbi:hypothetical protein AWENTII_008728 [Aspergillus wentii]